MLISIQNQVKIKLALVKVKANLPTFKDSAKLNKKGEMEHYFI